MPVTILKKGVCSNKEKILKIIGSTNFTCPRPFLDKLVLNAPVMPSLGESMSQSMQSAFKDYGVYPKATPSPGSARAVRIKLDSVIQAKHWPFFELQYKAGCISKVRLDFVPVDLGPDGMLELHAALTPLLPNGWNFMLSDSKISRVDVAINLPGVELGKILALPDHLASTSTFSTKGKITGFWSGLPAGHQWAIYDRGEKRKAKGQDWMMKGGLRIERRLRKLGISLSQLLSLENPFKALTMGKQVSIPPDCFKKNVWFWEFFLVSARTEGVTTALGKLPPEYRTAVRKHLKAHEWEWWDPIGIWSGWAPMLKKLRILDKNLV